MEKNGHLNQIKVSDIDTSGRLRPNDPAWEAALAASIEERGLDQPIAIRTMRPDEGNRPYKLVFGSHRLGAMISLGMTELVLGTHVKIVAMDDNNARLAEIDENLMRRELSTLDKALFLAERKRVYELINPETAHGGGRKSKVDILKDKIKSQNSATCDYGFKERFTKEAADKIGLSERAIQVLVQIANKLPAEVIALLRNTDLVNNQSALLALAGTEAGEQLEIASAIARGGYASVGHARVGLGYVKKVEGSPQQKAQAALLHNWSVADKHTRAAFLKAIGIDPATCQPYGGWTVNGILNPKKKG